MKRYLKVNNSAKLYIVPENTIIGLREFYKIKVKKGYIYKDCYYGSTYDDDVEALYYGIEYLIIPVEDKKKEIYIYYDEENDRYVYYDEGLGCYVEYYDELDCYDEDDEDSESKGIKMSLNKFKREYKDSYITSTAYEFHYEDDSISYIIVYPI